MVEDVVEGVADEEVQLQALRASVPPQDNVEIYLYVHE